MPNFCGFCGKALQPNAKFCIGCGKQVEEQVMQQSEGIAQEQEPVEQCSTNSFIPKMSSVSSEEVVTGKPEEKPIQKASEQQVTSVVQPTTQSTEQATTQPTAQATNYYTQAQSPNQNALNVQQPMYNTAGSSAVPAKKNNTGLIIGIVAAVLIICVGVLIFAISSFFNNQANSVFNADISMSSSMGDNIHTYSPNDKSFIISGTITGITEDTPIRLLWRDETIDREITDEVIAYATEDGLFYYELNCEELNYLIKGLTHPGEYSVTVSIDDKEFSQRIEFGVYSNPEGMELYSDYIHDLYMIEEPTENNRKVVYSYPEGIQTLKTQMFYVNAPEGEMVNLKWYRMEDGGWNIVDQQTFAIADEGEKTNTHNAWIESDGGYASGQYKVEIYVNETELAAVRTFTVGENANVSLDVPENTTQKVTEVTNIYMSDNVEGYNNTLSFPITIDKVYCQADIIGVTDETELYITWEDWATGDVLYYFMAEPSGDGSYAFDFMWSDFEQGIFPLGTYKVGIYNGDYLAGGELIASVDFDMVDPNGGEGELGDGELVGGEDGFIDISSVDLTEDEWKDMNRWLHRFTESRLPTFYDAWDLTDYDLIDFATIYSVFNKDEETLNTYDEGGYYWVSQQRVNDIIYYYFDLPSIESPQSTELVVFDPASGRYGIYGESIEEWPLVFPQVSEVYDLGDNIYEVVFDVYSVSINFDGDRHANPDEWKSANEMPEYIGSMDAIYELIGDNEKILLSYEWY